jgi:hypothetical protein
MDRRGELWTAREAERNLGLAKGTVDVWLQRGHVTRAVQHCFGLTICTTVSWNARVGGWRHVPKVQH